MLNMMRENLRHLKVVLWLTAISMVLYLGAFFSCEDPQIQSGDWSIRIDGDTLPRTDLIGLAQMLDGNYRQAFGEQYEQLRANLRIGSQAVESLITTELVRRDAKRLGLSISDGELAEAIRNDPSLSPDGQFVGQERYVQFMNSNYPGGVGAYERDISNQMLISKWSEMMGQSVTVTEADARELHRARTEKTAIDYVVFASADQQAELDADDATLRAYYDAHPNDYKRDPSRKVRYVTIDRDSYNDVTVSEDELRASYDANISRYTHGDQRSARHILLRIPNDADDAQKAALRDTAATLLSRVQGGEAFGPLAASLSEDTTTAQNGGDLGFFDRGAMVPSFDSAVWETTVGEFAPLVETPYGFHVVQVTGERAAGTESFESARPTIELQMKARAQQNRLDAETNRIHKAMLDGDFASVANAEGLTIGERTVSRKDPLTDIGASPAFIEAVFNTEAGSVGTPQNRRAGSILFVVDEVLAAERAPFEEVRSQVQSDVANDRLRDAALAAAQAADAAGRGPAAVANATMELRESGDLAPGQAPPGTGGVTPEFTDALFGDAIAVGDRGVLTVPSGAIYYEVVRREPFDESSYDLARDGLLAELQQEQRQALEISLLDGLRKQYKVEINQALVTQLDGTR